MSEVENPSAKMRLKAMNLLARREYSHAELEQRLANKFPESTDLIPEVLDRLIKQGLQSDERYVEAFCRSRISRGQGYARIKTELKQRGISESLADGGLRNIDVDWFELALDVARRRFGNAPSTEPKEIVKRMRFLRYRGFSQDQIRYALESVGDD